MIYMIIACYFEDDDSDELANDPVFKAVLEKDALASQPTIFNWFRRLVLSANMRKQHIDTVRLKLLKIATKVIHSARYLTLSCVVAVLIRMSTMKLFQISAN